MSVWCLSVRGQSWFVSSHQHNNLFPAYIHFTHHNTSSQGHRTNSLISSSITHITARNNHVVARCVSSSHPVFLSYRITLSVTTAIQANTVEQHTSTPGTLTLPTTQPPIAPVAHDDRNKARPPAYPRGLDFREPDWAFHHAHKARGLTCLE